MVNWDGFPALSVVGYHGFADITFRVLCLYDICCYKQFIDRATCALVVPGCQGRLTFAFRRLEKLTFFTSFINLIVLGTPDFMVGSPVINCLLLQEHNLDC